MLKEKLDHCTCCTPANSKAKRFKTVIVILAIVFCVYQLGLQFGLKPLLGDYETLNGSVCKTILVPGLYVMVAPPFIALVKGGEIGIMIKKSWGWHIESHPVTKIPMGHVGVLTEKITGLVQQETLAPGKHSIDPDKFDVTTVFTGKQTYYYTDPEMYEYFVNPEMYKTATVFPGNKSVDKANGMTSFQNEGE